MTAQAEPRLPPPAEAELLWPSAQQAVPVWARARPLLPALSYTALLACHLWLFWAGYPGWRAAVALSVTVVQLALHLHQFLRPSAAIVPPEVGLAYPAIIAAVTGGLRSPVLICTLQMAVWYVICRGPGRVTLRRLALYGVLLLGLGVAPRSVVGELVPSPLFEVWAAVVVAVGLGALTGLLFEVARSMELAVADGLHSREALATQALERTRELELISSKISHELKNPLSAARSLAQLTLRHARDPMQVRWLEALESEVSRLTLIVDEYLSCSRPRDALVRRPCALGPLVDEVLRLLAARASEAAVAMRREGDAEASIDHRRLRDAVLNLVANALDACQAGASVTVELADAGNEVRLTVRDTGRGMSTEVLEKLGTPFFTQKAAGTGLGVLLARRVLTEHGGTLEYRSTPGRGTVATARFPNDPPGPLPPPPPV